MNPDIYNVDGWLRPGDIVLSVPPKAGTHWLMYTVHMLRAKGKVQRLEDLYQEVPWAEFVYYPGQTVRERVEYVRNLTSKYGKDIAVYKSHLSPKDYKVRDEIRYIVGVRNPYDVASSLRAFYYNIDASLSDMWGGFPPGAGRVLLPDDRWEHYLTVDSGDGTPFLPRLLQPVASWWLHRRSKNVLFVHYSDRLKNDTREIERIAKFLQLELPTEKLQHMAKAVSFNAMKANHENLEPSKILQHFQALGKIDPSVRVLNRKVEQPVYVKGPSRTGTVEIPQSLRNKIKQTLYAQFGPEIAHWIESGGEFPMDADLPGPTTSSSNSK